MAVHVRLERSWQFMSGRSVHGSSCQVGAFMAVHVTINLLSLCTMHTAELYCTFTDLRCTLLSYAACI
jgi:hypothetical protein